MINWKKQESNFDFTSVQNEICYHNDTDDYDVDDDDDDNDDDDDDDLNSLRSEYVGASVCYQAVLMCWRVNLAPQVFCY